MSVYGFGQNSYGELALPGAESKVTPTLIPSCIRFSLSLTKRYRLNIYIIIMIGKDKNVIQIVAGNEHTVILTASGEIFSVG